MINITQYVKDELHTFDEKPFNPVDSLILAWMSYIKYPYSIVVPNSFNGIKIKDLYLAEHFDVMFKRVYDEPASREIFSYLACNPRYRNIEVKGYRVTFDKDEEKQFAAATFKLKEGLHYVSFRGTDATIVGWKEDFNMAYSYAVPAQVEAANYLNDVMKQIKGDILIGGHSKGGNLAVYAAINCDDKYKSRIKKIYSHDGPGFHKEVLESEDFLKIGDKIEKTVPQSSVFGMILESQENFNIVKSNKMSFWQHNPFSWMIEGDDFVKVDSLAAGARYFDSTISDWMYSKTREERELFIDTLFEIIETTDAKTFKDISNQWSKNAPLIFNTAANVDDETKSFIKSTVVELIKTAFKNVPELFKK